MVQRKLRFREVQELTQDHTASAYCSHISSLAWLTPTMLPSSTTSVSCRPGDCRGKRPRGFWLVLEAREALPRPLQWLRSWMTCTPHVSLQPCWDPRLCCSTFKRVLCTSGPAGGRQEGLLAGLVSAKFSMNHTAPRTQHKGGESRFLAT